MTEPEQGAEPSLPERFMKPHKVPGLEPPLLSMKKLIEAMDSPEAAETDTLVHLKQHPDMVKTMAELLGHDAASLLVDIDVIINSRKDKRMGGSAKS